MDHNVREGDTRILDRLPEFALARHIFIHSAHYDEILGFPIPTGTCACVDSHYKTE